VPLDIAADSGVWIKCAVPHQPNASCAGR
jgi:hypothetical protein